MSFYDRADAGRRLAALLTQYRRRPDVVVLALPRGGVAVGFEVATALEVPLDVFLVRKLGVPFQPELAMGAIASGGTRVLNPLVTDALAIAPEVLESVIAREQDELERRERVYRQGRPKLDVKGKTAILVDDGIATGSTMRAAVLALREQGVKEIVVAVPVAPQSALAELGSLADELVCVLEPSEFLAIGEWYQDFSQLTDEDVNELLRQAAQPAAKAG
ncbi:MAG TPA: phosphoribosyltransferase [Terriglobales bacterium]|nr:phosphoribosyltransferase [Terriglobales bacterium]